MLQLLRISIAVSALALTASWTLDASAQVAPLDPAPAAVCDLAQTHGLGLELRGEGAARPLREGFCLLVHDALRASILANLGVHGSEASAQQARFP